MSVNEDFKKIVIADDSRHDAEIVQKLLNDHGYSTVLVSSGLNAVDLTIQEIPDLVLIDVDRPGKEGYDLARALKQNRATRFVPIVMLTGRSELGAKLEGLEAGVDDYITKPYSPIELLARIRSLLRVKDLNAHLDDAESIVFSLARIIEAKDRFTLGHADRVARYAQALGKLMNCTIAEQETLHKGGLLHDIGKIAIPDSILLKPGTLNSSEFEVMKTHPSIGYSICERLRSAEDALPLIRHHHEKLNGEGYPDHLKGEEIPLLVRIVNIVDIYDALTSQRSYKDAWEVDQTFEEMQEEVEKGWWDGDILEIWKKAVRSGELKSLLAENNH